MFKFSSGHSSEQSIANHSSRPTALIAAEMWLRNYIKLILESPTTEDENFHSLFVQNSNQIASRLTATTSFPRVLFSTPAIFTAKSKLFGSQRCSDDRN